MRDDQSRPSFIFTKTDVYVGTKRVYAMLLKRAWRDDACSVHQAWFSACAPPYSPKTDGAPGPSLLTEAAQQRRLVPLAGLEPARCFHHLILSQARLPIPPQGQAAGS